MSIKRLFTILALILLTSFSMSAQKNLELPKIKSGEIIIRHTGHTLSYNPVWVLPNWVAYELRA